MTRKNFKVIETEVCVIGGGMTGICAAIASARHEVDTVLIHDRPVLGGNASSECRVHICGADRHNKIKHMRETGILEELRLENLYRNPQRSFSIWDLILYEKVYYQSNLKLMLNTSCCGAIIKGDFIESIIAWQLTTYTMFEIRAKIYIDCSGDAILTDFIPARYMVGRESRYEFGEKSAPEKRDNRTMGITCLFQAKDTGKKVDFKPPVWAYKFEKCEELPGRHEWFEMGYWWIELGGKYDTIRDTETIRDELLRITLGVWDHIKNYCVHRYLAETWAIDWLQFLPAKRESRRYIGEYILTQNDIEREGKFDDIVAYGGWPMDDHHPEGFWCIKTGDPPTVFYPTPSPYGIPYRILFSKDIKNLMFAGRNASCTHLAMSSTRVMGTCALMGQAAGTASSYAVKKGCLPSEILYRINEIQQILLWDDCWLPGVEFNIPELTKCATIISSILNSCLEAVRDGIGRQVGDNPHSVEFSAGDFIEYRWDKPQRIKEVMLQLDSGMDIDIQMSYHHSMKYPTSPPPVMPKEFRLLVWNNDGNFWETVFVEKENYQRHKIIRIDKVSNALRLYIDKLWGEGKSRCYGFYVR